MMRPTLARVARGLVFAALAGAMAPGAAIAQGGAQAPDAAAARRQVAVGPISISVPANWIKRKGPAPDNPHYDAPGPNRGLGPSVAIAIEDAQPETDADGVTILKRERATIGGRSARVRQWLSEEEDSQGVTVVFDDVLPGRSVMVIGWTPRADWPRRNGEIWEIVNSIAFRSAQSAPAAGPVERLDLGNTLAVTNGPRAATSINVKRPIFVRTLRTYHWNDGRGARPGALSLVDPSGRTLGPWPARGEPGQGGVPNAYWVANVNRRLEPGSYRLDTSRNETWATNEGVRWRGFYTMDYQVLPDAPGAGAQQPAPQPTPQTAQAPAPNATQPIATPAPQDGARALFWGDMTPWEPLATGGGDFKAFARLENGALAVSVPEGRNLGKTGMRSKAPMVRFDRRTPSRADVVFRFDPARTTSFVVAFGARSDPEEWNGHDARLAWTRAEDGGSATLTLWIRTVVVMSTKLAPQAPETLKVAIAPDGAISVETPEGTRIEGLIPQDAIDSGLYVYALAQAPVAHKPAGMVLRGVTLAMAPLATPAPQADGGARIVLFDGALGARFATHQAHGGDFVKHARLGRDGLTVEAPKDSGWAKVGVRSPGALFFLDRWSEGASAELVFKFDPARTTGFVIALTAPGAPPGGEPDAPALTLHWRRNANGAGARATMYLSPAREPAFDAQLLDPAPEEVRIVLSPDGARVIAEGWPDRSRPWDVLQEGQGLRVWTYAHPDQNGQPVRMALRSIALDLKPGRADAPVARTEASPPVVLFNGGESPAWTPVGVAGGDFARFATWGANRLVVETPEKTSWAGAGLLSTQPVLDLDLRLARAIHRLIVQVDPKATSGFEVAAGPEKTAETSSTNRIRASLVDTGAHYLLSLERSRALTWSRPVSRAFIERWDGRMSLDFGPNWTRVRLGEDGPAVRAPTGFEFFQKLHVSILSQRAREHETAKLALLGVASQWLAAPEAAAAGRWELIDNDAFDADAFLKELAAGATRAPKGAAAIGAEEAAGYLDAPAVRAPQPADAPAKERSGSLIDLLRPIGRAHAQTPAPDCAKAIGDHIDSARRIEITLGEQADVGGQLLNLGLTLLGKAKFEDGTVRETLRNTADKMVNAWQDGQAIGEDWKEDRTQDMVSHFMQAALKIGLTSDMLGDERGFRQARMHVKDVWYNAIRKLPEDRARALIAEMSATIKTGTPNHDLYKEIMDKGRDIDFGAAFGQGAEGEGKAMLWTLSNTALAAFLPQYAIGKEVAATIVETGKAARNFAVNESVRQLYSVWKEEIAKNGGQESRAFYDARTTMGYFPALEMAKAMLRAKTADGDKKNVSNEQAEAFLFRQFDNWFKADQAAAKQADGLAKANAAFANMKCRAALEREVQPKGAACEKELALFKRYADLDAQVRGRIQSWMQKGNACNSPAGIDGETGFLVCQLLEYGEDAYKKSLGKYLEQCGLLNYTRDRKDATTRVLDRLPTLNDSKLKAVLDRAGVSAPGEFMNCLCPNGFHYFSGPGATGPCRRIGPLGGPSWAGFNPNAWAACAKAHPLKDGRTIVDAIADTLTGIHIDQK